MGVTRESGALEQLRKELISGDMTAYREHYESYREAYVNFARRYTDDQELIADSYHDAFIALYENIVEGRLTSLHSSLRTYVFSVAKYTLFAKLKKRGKEISTDEITEEVSLPSGLMDTSLNDERIEEVRRAIQNLGNKCREILVLFYYRRYTIDAITHAMSYKNENTAKAHKSRCLKQLRELVHQKAKQED